MKYVDFEVVQSSEKTFEEILEEDMHNAALQLIRDLYINGNITETVYKNILNDCKNHIDISDFT